LHLHVCVLKDAMIETPFDISINVSHSVGQARKRSTHHP
jgi:hypothetical protein